MRRVLGYRKALGECVVAVVGSVVASDESVIGSQTEVKSRGACLVRLRPLVLVMHLLLIYYFS